MSFYGLVEQQQHHTVPHITKECNDVISRDRLVFLVTIVFTRS